MQLKSGEHFTGDPPSGVSHTGEQIEACVMGKLEPSLWVQKYPELCSDSQVQVGLAGV